MMRIWDVQTGLSLHIHPKAIQISSAEPASFLGIKPTTFEMRTLDVSLHTTQVGLLDTVLHLFRTRAVLRIVQTTSTSSSRASSAIISKGNGRPLQWHPRLEIMHVAHELAAHRQTTRGRSYG
jgi:hypothetical protein